MYRPFKFSITFENARSPGYYTEKALNGILGNTIPIYWGETNVSRIVNPDRVILCNLTPENMELFKKWPSTVSSEEQYNQVISEMIETSRAPFLASMR